MGVVRRSGYFPDGRKPGVGRNDQRGQSTFLDFATDEASENGTAGPRRFESSLVRVARDSPGGGATVRLS